MQPRHFLEILGWVLSWSGTPAVTSVRYGLQLQVYEVVDGKLTLMLMEDLLSSETWPSPALPEAFDRRLRLEMVRSGHVRWRMEGAPPQRRWIMRPGSDGP